MSSSSLSSRRTRISAHFLDALPSENDVVTVEGWLTFYDEQKKSWVPMERSPVYIYVDSREVGSTETNQYGMFSFSFPAPYYGKHKLEVRFKGKPGYEVCRKSLEFQVVKKEEKLRLGRLARNILIILIALIFLMFLTVFISKMFVR